MKILYLEDNPDDVELFRFYVLHELPTVEVEIVWDYSGFMQAIYSQNNYAVIITDYRVPGFNGLSAIDVAKKERPGVPIIFITGTRPDLMPDAARSGADYMIEKSPGLMDLMVLLKKLLMK